MRWRRARRSSWPPPEIAELLELSEQLRRVLLAVQGRHRPTLEDMALADRLAAHVLAERHGGCKQESAEEHQQKNSTRRSTPYRLAESGLSIACKGVPAPVGAGAMTVLCSGQPADYRDDELELVDDDDLELDLLDDLGDGQED